MFNMKSQTALLTDMKWLIFIFMLFFMFFFYFFSFTLLNDSSWETVTISLRNWIQPHVQLTSWNCIHYFKSHSWNLLCFDYLNLVFSNECAYQRKLKAILGSKFRKENWVSLWMGTDNDPSLFICFLCLLHQILLSKSSFQVLPSEF